MGTATWWAGSMVFEGPRGSRGPTRRAMESPERPATWRRVVFPGRRGEPCEAFLSDAGVWSCPALPVLDRVLNALYAPGGTDRGEANWGRPELIRVAAWLKGEVASGHDPAP